MEVAHGGDHVLVRPTGTAEGSALAFGHREWAAFLTGVRSGEFDPGPGTR